jgi:2-methylcitrate dehydratase PrpD
MSNESLTRYVAEWVAALSPADIPDAVRATATRHVLDGYGLALSGHAEESHAILCRYAATVAAAPQVRVLGTPDRSSAELAALVNGLGMHAMDFDDTQLATDPESVYGLLTHPTTPVLGAASAAAELEDASGAELLTAYVAGVEVACRIADAVNPRHYQQGFHSTGTIGAFGAAAAAGRLMGLSAEQLRVAFGIAAPLGGGYRENFGTMTKPLHAGQAASAGVFAARLARDGFTAAETILEAPRGFYNAAAGGYDPARIADCLGRPFFFESPGISIKPYPSGSLSHPGQDAILELVREHDVHADDVESALVATNSATTNALIYPLPQTALEGKFSFPFLLAIAILRHEVGVDEFRDEVVRSSEVQELMKRSRHVADPEIDARGFHHMETRIEITLKDGRVLTKTESVATGHPDKPMSQEQLERKFLECAALAIDQDSARRAMEQIWAVEELDRVADLHTTLAGVGADR